MHTAIYACVLTGRSGGARKAARKAIMKGSGGRALVEEPWWKGRCKNGSSLSLSLLWSITEDCQFMHYNVSHTGPIAGKKRPLRKAQWQSSVNASNLLFSLLIRDGMCALSTRSPLRLWHLGWCCYRRTDSRLAIAAIAGVEHRSDQIVLHNMRKEMCSE